LNEASSREDKVSDKSIVYATGEGPSIGRQRSESIGSDNGLLERHSADPRTNKKPINSKDTL